LEHFKTYFTKKVETEWVYFHKTGSHCTLLTDQDVIFLSKSEQLPKSKLPGLGNWPRVMQNILHMFVYLQYLNLSVWLWHHLILAHVISCHF